METTIAVAETDPALGVDIAGAVATTQGINVFRLFEVMKDTIPEQILDITRVLVIAKPELAYDLEQNMDNMLGGYTQAP